MKICSKCKMQKSRNDFYKDKTHKDGYMTSCRECSSKAKKVYNSTPEIKERVNKREREYMKRQRVDPKYRETEKEYMKLRRLDPKFKERVNEREKERRMLDPPFKLRRRVSGSIRFFVKSQSISKNNSIWSKLPYTPQQLKEHLEKQFTSEMNWENYGSYWHIDHIYPQSLLVYNSLEHPNFLKCWDLSNLRPLEAKENLKKGNKTLNGK